MKVVIPVKRTPDPYGKIRLTSDGRVDDSDIKWVVNPFDEIAIEEAVRLRENGLDIEIITVSVGTSHVVEQLRVSLAMGADRSVHVEYEGDIDPGIVSFFLSKVIEQESADLVLMGKQAIDGDYGQVGGRLAGLLNWPQATFASNISIDESNRVVEVAREIDSGQETIRLKLSAVVTVDLRLNEPRYVALPAIIKARSKPIDTISASELGTPPDLQISIVKLEEPPARKAGRKVGSVGELISVLKNEAKVV